MNEYWNKFIRILIPSLILIFVIGYVVISNFKHDVPTYFMIFCIFLLIVSLVGLYKSTKDLIESTKQLEQSKKEMEEIIWTIFSKN